MAAMMDRLRARKAHLSSRWFELLYALGPVVGLSVLAEATVTRPELGGLESIVFLVIVPLSARRLWPLAVLVLVATGVLLTSTDSPAPWVEVGAVGLAAFTLGERGGDRTRSALAVLAVAFFVAIGFVAKDAGTFNGLVFPFIVLVPTWLVGDLVRARRVDAERHVKTMEVALRERESRMQLAAADERRQVARELHDVVAHSVSVMVIQAGAARQLVRTSPERAERSMLAVESTGREAMTELRRFLGVLSDDNEAAGLAPQPGLGELSTLLARVNEAGLPASLEVAGTPRRVTASLDVAVYRIVQEALTNALRYARQAATVVRLSWEPDQLRVEVLDEGPLITDGEGSGRGLVGMRERASLVGGRLEAGARSGGGYAVRAWLPLDPRAPSLEPGTR